MVHITFNHSRDIFKKNEFQVWIKRSLKSARFEGCESGNYYPTISISTDDFLKWKAHRMADEKQKSRIVRIRGEFDILEQLSIGIRSFDNDLRNVNEGEDLINQSKEVAWVF